MEKLRRINGYAQLFYEGRSKNFEPNLYLKTKESWARIRLLFNIITAFIKAQCIAILQFFLYL